MIRPSHISPSRSVRFPAISCISRHLALLAAPGILGLALGGTLAHAQAITINTHTGNVSTESGTVDRRFAQVTPTNVPLGKGELDAKSRQEVIRVLQAEQGFAMRPFPMGHKGLTLEANGKLTPAGESYLNMVTEFGICAKPGDRVVLTDVKIEKNKIVFELNGGPDLKHRILRHVSLGTGPATTPVVQSGNDQPVGSRLTLEFKGGHIPDLTGAQVKALLAPLISFDVKTPIQAFTDTLPSQLKQAILDHHVLVGMSTDMVLFALGQPQRKVRETQEQMPFEEWIYGAPPDPVQFVRINGNRVIRVEVAKVGEAPEIFTKDEVEGLMRTDGSPIIAVKQGGEIVKMGDVQRNPDTQSAAAPPTLTAPGETLPDHAQTGAGAMKPVQFPTQKPDDYPDATNLPRDHKAAADDADDDQAKPKTTGSSGSTQPTGQGSTTPPAQPTTAPATTPTDSAQPH